MNERLLYLRKTLLGLSRAKFGQAVGMSDSEIKNIETGLTQLKENKLPLICSAYNVNETWLRTGEGEPFLPKSREEQIAELVGQALTGSNEFKKAVVQMICSRTDAELQTLESALRAIYENL